MSSVADSNTVQTSPAKYPSFSWYIASASVTILGIAPENIPGDLVIPGKCLWVSDRKYCANCMSHNSIHECCVLSEEKAAVAAEEGAEMLGEYVREKARTKTHKGTCASHSHLWSPAVQPYLRQRVWVWHQNDHTTNPKTKSKEPSSGKEDSLVPRSSVIEGPGWNKPLLWTLYHPH